MKCLIDERQMQKVVRMIFFSKQIQIDRGDHRRFCNDDIITDSWGELGSDINFVVEAEKAWDRSPH